MKKNNVLIVTADFNTKFKIMMLLKDNGNVDRVFESKNGFLTVQMMVQYKPSIIITEHFLPLGRAEQFIDKAAQEDLEIKFITLFDHRTELSAEYHDRITASIDLNSVSGAEFNDIISEALKEPVTNASKKGISHIDKNLLLNQILLGTTSQKKLAELSEDASLGIKNGELWLVYIQHSAKQNFSFYSNLPAAFEHFDRITGILKDYYGGEVFIAAENRVAILINSGPALYSSDQLSSLLRRIKLLNDQYPLWQKTVLLSSSESADIKNICKKRENLDHLAANLFFLNNAQIVMDKDVGFNRNISYKPLIDQSEKLREAVKSYNEQDTYATIEYIFDEIIQKSGSEEFYNFAIQTLLSCANYFLFEVDNDIQKPLVSEKHESLSEAKKWFLDQYDELFRKIKNYPTNPLVRKAYKYISDNYSRDISLQSVSDHVAVTPIYLCRLFSQNLNKGFSEILNEIRIKEACNLIAAGNQRVSDISRQVGYNTPKYFSKMFKRQMGVTPKEYMQKRNQ